MQFNKIIQINNAPLKQVMVVSMDILIASFVKDEDLFFISNNEADSTEEELADLAQKGKEFFSGYPYCLPYALSSGDMRPRRFEYKGKFMEFSPSKQGLATIRDYDILLYCESWIGRAALEGRDDDISNQLEFEVEDFYKFCGRARREDRDDAFIQALDRLAGSTLITNTMPFGQDSESKPIQYIWDYKLERDSGGKIRTATIRVPYRICFLMERHIMTIFNKAFFDLSPVRRAVYMFLSNYCSEYDETVTVSFAKLHQAVGATSPLRKFMVVIDDLAAKPLPDFLATINAGDETITFTCTLPRNDLEESGCEDGDE